MDLPKPLKNTADTAAQLNSCLPEGLQVHDIRLHSGKIPQSVVTSYTVTLPRELTHDEIMAKDTFLDSEHFLIKRKRKGLEKEIDIRPLVEDIATVNEKTLRFRIKSTAGTPGIKVQEALAHILSWRQEELIEIRIVKASWSDLNE